jgi:hypothetical protein
MQYITAAEVRERLLGKVRFTDDIGDENAVSSGFLEQIIEESEAEVEMRLSIRYEAPFQGDNGEAFSTLPMTTQVQIKTLCRLDAVRRVLAYDFGRGSAADGDKYAQAVEKDFESRLGRVIEYREGQFGQFRYPPLPNLRLAAHNSEGDDGYAGRILVTSDGLGGGAPGQMPSPGETFWNGRLFER